MGTKARTTKRAPKFSSKDDEKAEKLCDYWRRVIKVRDGMIAEIDASPDKKHPRIEGYLDDLDAALAEVKVEGKSNVDRIVHRNKPWLTVEAVGAVEELLDHVVRLEPGVTEKALIGTELWDGAPVVELELLLLEFAARACGVSCSKLENTISASEVQALIPTTWGKSMRKAALQTVGILRNVSASTVGRDCDRESRTRTLARHLGDPRLDDLSAFRIERYKRDRLREKARSPKASKTVQPATVNREVTLLKHLCGLALSWGWMSSDIADAIRAVKPLKEPPGRVRYLSDDERSRLFGKMGKLNTGLRPVVEAALLLGMRLSEVITLRKTAVDLAHRNLTLIKTKNNKVRRLPVNEALAEVLENAMAGQESQFVFLNTKGKPYSVGGVSAGFAKAVKRAGIEDFHFHDLRHDFATQVRRRGTGLDVIAALLGHSSLAMAQRYAHIGNAELVAAVSGVEAVPDREAEVIKLRPQSESGADSPKE